MNASEVVTSRNVDLTNCDKERIDIPGSIQPHGLLFVLTEPELTILQVSDNTSNFLGIQAKELLNKNLSILFDKYHIDLLKSCLIHEDLQTKNPLKFAIDIEANRKILFDGIVHRLDGVLILELESSKFTQNISFLNFYDLIRASVSKLQNATSLNQMCQSMVQEIRKINGFDRVMVYKFDTEGNGSVIAENKLEHLTPYLGLNYPATDIPKQARKLYALNWLRLIVDLNYQPVRIIPENNPLNDTPIDLSLSVLRSVSPLHIEYLQNMGVRASMSISLMKNNQLWGLIACHHYSPKFVSYEVRKACEFLGQVMSLELLSKEDREDYDYKLKLKSIQEKILEYMSIDSNFVDGLVDHQPNLLDLVSAQGAVVYLDDRLTLLGQTPDLEDIKDMTQWLNEHSSEYQEIFYTESLAKINPEWQKFKDKASGLLAISISKIPKNYVLWFRPEVIHTVNWAGDPHKPVEVTEDGDVRLSPRKSFDLWQETVKFTSLPWKNCEIDAARGLRNGLINIVLRKAEELAQLNIALQESEAQSRQQATELENTLIELKRTQTQLIQSEKMSSLGQLVAGVAHEINNPINFIYGNINHAAQNTQDLINLINLYQQYYPTPESAIQEEIEAIDLEFVAKDLPKILSSMKVGAERIQEIVQSLRTFSRLDEAEIKSVDIHEGIDSTLMILQHRLKVTKNSNQGIKIIKQYGQLPLVECYPGQLNQVFMNLIANAIDAVEEFVSNKVLGDRSEKEIRPTVLISTQLSESSKNVQIRIADNGAGITEEVQRRIFDPFFTTKPVGQGTGIGLALSYQIIVEKHHGQLKCFSTPGEGTEFIIEIPLRQV